MAAEIVLKHSPRQALQIPQGRVVDQNTGDDWVLVLFGKPNNLLDVEDLKVEVINQGENSIDYEIYTDLACSEPNLLINSRMRLEASASVVAAASALVSITSQPAHIKIYVKSTTTGQTSRVDVAVKGRG